MAERLLPGIPGGPGKTPLPARVAKLYRGRAAATAARGRRRDSAAGHFPRDGRRRAAFARAGRVTTSVGAAVAGGVVLRAAPAAVRCPGRRFHSLIRGPP